MLREVPKNNAPIIQRNLKSVFLFLSAVQHNAKYGLVTYSCQQVSHAAERGRPQLEEGVLVLLSFLPGVYTFHSLPVVEVPTRVTREEDRVPNTL